MGLRLTTGGVGTEADSRKEGASTLDAAGRRRAALAGHEALHILQAVEAEAAVELVGVGGPEHPAAEALQLGGIEDRRHQALAEAIPAGLGLDVDGGEPREGRRVGYDAREAGLPAIGRVNAEADRVLDRAVHHLTRNARRPVRLRREEVVDAVQVEPRLVRRYLVLQGWHPV